MKEKFIRFMQGRYGADSFSRFLLGAAVVLMVLSLFLKGQIWYVLSLALLIYVYIRMFSKNIQKRYTENQKFLQLTAGIREKWNRFRKNAAGRKTHHIYKCPNCKQKIRVPRGKGKIAVRCPKCSTEFMKKS